MLSVPAGALAPAAAVIPLACIAMFVLAGNVLALAGTLPPLRRRLRTGTSLLMLLAVPIAAFALGWADPLLQPREFVIAWMLVVGLLALVMFLALADIAFTWAVHRAERSRLVASLADATR
jgi:cytochrome bd-type quinol oxidase subunit 2